MFAGLLLSVSAVVLMLAPVNAPAPRATSQVVGSGNPACNVEGSARFAPPLVDGGTRPTVVTIKGKLTACRNAFPSAPTPYGITTGTMKARFTLPTNDCQRALSAGYRGNPTGAFTLKWRGATHLEPSVVTVGNIDLNLFTQQVTGSGDPYIGDVSMPGSLGTVTGSGSFATSFLIFRGRFAGTDAQVQTACTPKAVHLPGGGGLRTLPLLNSLSFVTASG